MHHVSQPHLGNLLCFRLQYRIFLATLGHLEAPQSGHTALDHTQEPEWEVCGWRAASAVRSDHPGTHHNNALSTRADQNRGPGWYYCVGVGWTTVLTSCCVVLGHQQRALEESFQVFCSRRDLRQKQKARDLH
jgi:hypothetical protein